MHKIFIWLKRSRALYPRSLKIWKGIEFDEFNFLKSKLSRFWAIRTWVSKSNVYTGGILFSPEISVEEVSYVFKTAF